MFYLLRLILAANSIMFIVATEKKRRMLQRFRL